MNRSSTEEYDVGGSSSSTEGMPAGQRCQSIDSLAEWRSSEQVENETPSSSPPFWDNDDDDDCGSKPSELYGKFTWKIENFRQINKRELRSNAFEVGGYKWYILIYPQGCDVCNHLSLFLCVANHDKLLPGWSHFAQFTIAVVNKDPKKSKFSDTLHRFWKKEHDWGWKKFMENSKVYESFVNDDTLVIKAQVQVIREKANRPFRCLDCQYRRELVRVYISNVEQICRRFIEDRKNKLSKLIEDETRWSSFRSFWIGVDQSSRRRMSRDKLDTILRIVVKQFFVEKEVTSTLVMDSLHSGLKALEHHSKNMKGRLKIETEESHDPMVRVDKEMFILGDDVVLLLDRVASEPLPTTSLPPKDDKALLNRAKEGSCCEEFNKDSLERDERRLTELGQRTMEICAIAHIFSSRIEVAYQEAVALKRQEELIREEEATGQTEHELKVKRAADKEKRVKKKQAKQKRNSHRSKDQLRDMKSALALKESQRDNSVDEIVFTELSSNPEQFISEKVDIPEDAPDVSYAREVAEIFHPNLDDKDSFPVNWDTDASEAHPCMGTRASDYSNEQPEKRSPIIDDSSSTCSTDSVPSVVSNGPYKGFSAVNNRSQDSPNRVKNQLSKDLLSQGSVAGHFGDSPRSDNSCLEMVADAAHLIHSKLWPEKHVIDKHGRDATVQKKIIPKNQADTKRLLAPHSIPKVSSASARSGRQTLPLALQLKKSLEISTTSSSTMAELATDPAPIKPPPATNPPLAGRSGVSVSKLPQSSSRKSESQSAASTSISKNTTAAQASSVISRPSSTPLIPGESRPAQPVGSKVQKLPQLLRSVGSAGSLEIDPSPQSHRNAIIRKTTMGLSTTGPLDKFSIQSSTPSASTSFLLPPACARKEQQTNFRPSFMFGSVKPETLPDLLEQREGQSGSHQVGTTSSHLNGQSNGSVADDFPHLDIINDLLDEEQSITGNMESSGNNPYYASPHPHGVFRRQYSFPDDATFVDLSLLGKASGYDHTEQYYDDRFHGVYPQMDLLAPYAFEQMDGGVAQIHWSPYGHADAYPYQFSNYTAANGYGGMYRQP